MENFHEKIENEKQYLKRWKMGKDENPKNERIFQTKMEMKKWKLLND